VRQRDADGLKAGSRNKISMHTAIEYHRLLGENWSLNPDNGMIENHPLIKRKTFLREVLG